MKQVRKAQVLLALPKQKCVGSTQSRSVRFVFLTQKTGANLNNKKGFCC
ncbi:hypothetical protein O9993_02295 [Vibrio lentus]|nr:hypothetical protein [Vibrio lentus]